jgi:Flp pilus assembly CpaE family ATPase
MSSLKSTLGELRKALIKEYAEQPISVIAVNRRMIYSKSSSGQLQANAICKHPMVKQINELT